MHPYLLHAGHFSLPTFGVLAACGLMLALFLSQHTALIVGLPPDALWDAGLFAVISAFLLSRLLLIATHFHSFLTYPILLLAVPSLTPFGLMATGLATLAWLRAKHLTLLPALDAWAPCATLVWAFLALAHYAEGSDPGMPSPGTSPSLQPVALYAAAAAILLTAVSFFLLTRPQRAGQSAAITLIASGCAQFLLSFLRQPGPDAPLGLDPLQYVALGMIATGCVLWLASQPHKPAMMEPATPEP